MLREEHRQYIDNTRIKAARYAIGMSVAAAAQELGVSPDLYYKFESGEKDGTRMVALLASVFRRPEAYFFAEPVDMPPLEAFTYRKQQSMRKSHQETLRARSYLTVLDLRPTFDRFVGEYEVNIPRLERLSPEDAAMSVREAFNLGGSPLKHALDLLETMGVFVHWHDGPKEFEAVSYWAGNRPVMVLNSNKPDGYRSRFSILHELGHFCLHRSVPLRDSFDKEADRFASAMLMPASTFARWCPRRFERYTWLENRRTWGASIGAMVRRARDLSVFTDYQYRDARISLAQAGWATKEPSPPAPERSSLHRAFFEAAGDQGITPFDLAEMSKMRYESFVEACPQAVEYERTERMADLFEKML